MTEKDKISAKQIKYLFQVKHFQEHFALLKLEIIFCLFNAEITVSFERKLLKKGLPVPALPLWVLPWPGWWVLLLLLGALGAMTDTLHCGLEQETCSCTFHGI